MTAAVHPQTLPLRNWPGHTRGWLLVLALGIPVLVVTVATVLMLAHGPASPSVLYAPAFVLVVCAIAMLWILRMFGRIAIALDGATLIVDSGIATRRFSLASLRAGSVRVMNLDEHIELKPVFRTWGIGMPGLASGWFRLRNGSKAFCVLTGRERVTVLRADDGLWILLSLADPSPLQNALA